MAEHLSVVPLMTGVVHSNYLKYILHKLDDVS